MNSNEVNGGTNVRHQCDKERHFFFSLLLYIQSTYNFKNKTRITKGGEGKVWLGWQRRGGEEGKGRGF